MRLTFANIEKMNDVSLLELDTAPQNLKASHRMTPILIGLAETWESISAHKAYKLPGYTYIGKPIKRNPGATRDHGGTGAWILDSIFDQCSVVDTKKQHQDVMWLQMVDKHSTTYIAVVYSRPPDKKTGSTANQAAIMSTLEHNHAELSRNGRVVIMGDFNARITRTTRKTESKYGVYENRLLDMMDRTGLRPLVATTETMMRNEHWTCVRLTTKAHTNMNQKTSLKCHVQK